MFLALAIGLTVDSVATALIGLILSLGLLIWGTVLPHEEHNHTLEGITRQVEELGVDRYVNIETLISKGMFVTSNGTVYYLKDGEVFKK